jgi:hypothetical protein
MYKAVQLKSKNPTHWNLIGRSMTAPPPVLSPSSIHLNALSFPEGKIRGAFKKCFHFFYFSQVAEV